MAPSLWSGLLLATIVAVPAAAQSVATAVNSTTAAAAPKPKDTAPADSLADADASLLRETFTYGGAPRDPFVSLIKTAHAGPELGDLQLVGIYEDLRYSGNSIAILREKTKDGKRHKLRVGDQLGRLRVTQIRPKEVVFTIQDFGYERQETLSLRKQEDLTP